MSLKSILGKVGKVALKVAPYAAMAIPGVGVPLGMAISGAASAASKKLEGGSWKSSLLAGGIGAGGAALGGAGKALSKIGPSSSVTSKLLAGAAGKGVGTGATGKVGAALGNMGLNALTSKTGQGLSNYKDLGGAVPAGLSAFGSSSSNRSSGGNPSNAFSNSNSTTNSAVPRSSQGNAPGFQFGSNNPNLADSILMGQKSAIKNQPFRAGYDVYGNMPDATDENPNPTRPILSHMPAITSPFDSKRRRQQAAY